MPVRRARAHIAKRSYSCPTPSSHKNRPAGVIPCTGRIHWKLLVILRHFLCFHRSAFFPSFFLSPFFLSFPALSLSSQRMAPSNNRALYRFQSCHGRCTTPLKNSLGGKKRVFFSLLYPPLSSRRKSLVYSVVQHRSIKTYELLLVKHVIINDNKVENNILERTFFYISLFIL